MNATHRNHIKKLERIDSELAALRDEHARICVRIAELETTRRTGIAAFASEIVSGLDLSRVSVSQLMDRLATLNDVRHADDDSAATEGDVNHARGDVNVFVRISRNASVEKRALLDAHGLRWNGRTGGWSGSVSATQLAKLHLVFKSKVTARPMPGADEPSAISQESAVSPVCAGDTGQHEPDATQTMRDRADQVEQSPVRPVMTTTLFRGLPVRRPPASLPDPESPA